MDIKSPFHYIKHSANFVSIMVATELQLNVEPNEALASLDVVQQSNWYKRQLKVFLQRFVQSSTLSTMNLRYIYTPTKSTKQAHPRFTIACLFRFDGQSVQEAQQKAEIGWNEIIGAFPHQMYKLIVAEDSIQFNKLYLPIKPNEAKIVEIRKKEEITPTRYIAEGDYFYSILPISTESSSLENALIPISNQEYPFVVNICLSPTMLTYEEEYTIGEILSILEKFAVGFTTTLMSGTTVFEPDPNAKICFLRYNHILQTSRIAYQFRCQLISPKDIPEYLATSVASVFTTNHDLEFASDNNIEIARQTYELLHPFFLWGWENFWSKPGAPQSIRRLSYLINVEEATSLFKLPTMFHQKQLSSLIYIENQGRIDQVGDRKVTIKGNNINANVAMDAVFGDMKQALNNSPSSNTSDLSPLISMLNEIKSELDQIPQGYEEDRDVVVRRVQKLVDELKSESPDKDDLEHNGKKLLKAAENIQKITPNVLEIAKQIVKFIVTLV